MTVSDIGHHAGRTAPNIDQTLHMCLRAPRSCASHLMGVYEASADVGGLWPSRWPVSTSVTWSV